MQENSKQYGHNTIGRGSSSNLLLASTCILFINTNLLSGNLSRLRLQ